MKKVIKLRDQKIKTLRSNLCLCCCGLTFLVGYGYTLVGDEYKFACFLGYGTVILIVIPLFLRIIGISYKFVFSDNGVKIKGTSSFFNAKESDEYILYQQFSTVRIKPLQVLSLLNSEGDAIFTVSLKNASQNKINELLNEFKKLGKAIKLYDKIIIKSKNKNSVHLFLLSISWFVILLNLSLNEPPERVLIISLLFFLILTYKIIPQEQTITVTDVMLSLVFRHKAKSINLSDISKIILSNEKLLLLYNKYDENELRDTFDLKKFNRKNIQILLNYLQMSVPVYVEDEIQKRGKFVLYEQPTQINTNAVETMSTQNNILQSNSGRRRVVSNANSRPQPMKQPNNTFTGYRPQTMNHPSNTFTNDDTPSRRLEL